MCSSSRSGVPKLPIVGPYVNVRIDLQELATPPQVLVREEDGGPVAFVVFDGPGFRVSFVVREGSEVEAAHGLLDRVQSRLGAE